MQDIWYVKEKMLTEHHVTFLLKKYILNLFQADLRNIVYNMV